MRDYAELIKDLRESAEWSDRLAVLMGRDVGDSKAPLMRKAADAIEELLAKVPTWISVEERLPDDWKPVLAYDPIGYGEIGIAFILGSLNTVVWRGVGFTNTAYPPNVTHWMTLPAPPKGVE